MTPKALLFGLVLLLGAARPAAAQDSPDLAYQKALLSRSLSAADQAICDAKTAGGAGAVKDACRVTRLFLADIDAGRAKIFPPLADIRYTVNKGEQNKIVDYM